MPQATTESDPLEVKLATANEVTTSRDAWNALAAAMKYPTIFCTWEWIHTWWKHFGSAHELVVLFIYRGKELRGILPLFLENRRKSVFALPRRMGFCGSTRLFPDHLDIICAMDDAMVCIDAAFCYLNTVFTRWDILRLPYLAEDSNLYTWLVSNRGRFKWRETGRTIAPYIRISGSFEDYLGSFKGSQRYSIVRHKRKLFKNSAASYVGCRDEDMAAALNMVFDLHARRAVTKQIVSSFSGDEIFRFHMDFLEETQGRNWVWIRFLKCGEDTIAAYYGFVFGNRVFYYQSGQDPDWRVHAPGTVILHDAIQEAFIGKYDEFNFLQGEEEYKQKWTKTRRVLHDIAVYHGNLPGRTMILSDLIKQALKTVLGNDERQRRS
jgi:CelD/BcsL family acetyltransferase involved in cellulose biosynthesis